MKEYNVSYQATKVDTRQITFLWCPRFGISPLINQDFLKVDIEDDPYVPTTMAPTLEPESRLIIIIKKLKNSEGQ